MDDPNRSSSRVDFVLPIRTEETLREYVRLALGVTFPDVKVCPNHTTPWRAFCDAYFAKAPVMVWKGSRGFGGKTFMLGILGLTEAQTLGIDVNVLGGSGEQSKKVLSYITRYGAGERVKQLLAGDVQRETRFTNGAKVVALAASQTSVRGPHVARLRLDEIDEMDLAVLDSALGQTMRQRGVETNVVMSSTHQYPDKTMTAILERAAEKGWPVYEWCWRETSAQPGGWLALDEIERKRQEITSEMWRVEYDLQEASPEDRAILTEKVNEMFDPALGEYEGRPNEYLEFEPPAVGGEYVTGADWAKKSNYTTIITARIDVWPHRVVAFQKMNRRAWPLMVRAFDERVDRYPGESAHDATGVGDVVADYSMSDARGNIMAGRRRINMIQRYIVAVENGEYKSPRIRSMMKEHEYVTNEDLWGSGHLPDSLSAMTNLHSRVGAYSEEDSSPFGGYRG